MFIADAALARRLESAEAALARGCASPAAASGHAVLEIAGGCGIFMGADSPLTQSVGLGLDGPVAAADLDALEAFFRSRGAPVRIDVCPLAHSSLVDGLSVRGYRVTEFHNVLALRLDDAAAVPAPRARLMADSEVDLWSLTVGRGFFETATLTEDEMDVGRAIVAAPGVRCYLAFEEDQAAGGGAMLLDGRLAVLCADSSLARFRRRGLHRELIAARIADAGAAGCDAATASTLPGSASQRSYERLGFRVAYTRVTLVA